MARLPPPPILDVSGGGWLETSLNDWRSLETRTSWAIMSKNAHSVFFTLHSDRLYEQEGVARRVRIQHRLLDATQTYYKEQKANCLVCLLYLVGPCRRQLHCNVCSVQFSSPSRLGRALTVDAGFCASTSFANLFRNRLLDHGLLKVSSTKNPS